MASGHRAVIGFLIFAAFIFGIVVGYVALLKFPRRRYLASAEYWVYLPDENLPDQSAVMTRTIGLNPYSTAARPAVNTPEALLFSDVRTHIALVLRRKNPHAFRPDLFDPSIEATPEMLEALAQAKSFVKVRYVSEDPLPDARHLQFLPHVADAVAELGEGRLIYDVGAERLLIRSDLEQLLATKVEVSGPDVHARVLWKPEIDAGHAETRGLTKIGLRELRTPQASSDQRVLILRVMEEAVRTLWQEKRVPESLEVTAYDDRFRVLFFPARRDPFVRVRIMRVRST